MGADPTAVYSERLRRAREVEAREAVADAGLSTARLAVFGAGAALAWLAWRGDVSAWWLATPLAAFVALIVRHDRVIQRRDRARRTAEWYDRGLARVEDRWIGTGETGERFLDERHPYAADLDIFGRGSLFELLSTARSRAGEETLARWLLDGADAATIHARQAAVQDLAARTDLREDLALAGTRARTEVHPDRLVAWSHEPRRMPAGAPRWAAIILTTVTLGMCGAWAFGVVDSTRVLSVLAVQAIAGLAMRQRLQRVLHGAEEPARELLVLGEILARLEREPFDAPLLRQLVGGLGERPRASEAIRSLGRLLEVHAWEHNQLFAPIAALLLLGTHLAFAIEAWRARFGPAVPRWLALAGELEALASIGTYAFEHPADVFPEVENGPARFHAAAVVHPLLPRATAVANDVVIEQAARAARAAGLKACPTSDPAGLAACSPYHPALLLVSGSNMSGKSTLLRTVGVNTVLALAGAPVRAAALTLTPVSIGATLRIQDSLTAGRSRFFAEITRLKELRDLSARPRPLLFLLDELFHGTNSHDRVAGAAGVLRAFLDAGAIGLVTTHDLAMSAIVADLGRRAANVHFEDQFVEGEMRFDYRLRPGPVTRSNALALMRAIGLEVSSEMQKVEGAKVEVRQKAEG